jgi:hypothetical protein
MGDLKMSIDHLAVYLRDHRAGATAAVELLNHLEQAHANTPLARFAADLRAEVSADVRELENLINQLAIEPSRTRNAVAWLSEKAAELKMHLDDPGDGALRLLETLEALSLGIEGKRSLWLALDAVRQSAPPLASLDYPRLVERAETQRRLVETQRLQAARAAFGSAAH